MLYGKPPFLPSSSSGGKIDFLLEAIETQKLVFDDEKIKVSDDAKDLIRKMLVVDPENRIDFPEFFDHRWVKLENK